MDYGTDHIMFDDELVRHPITQRPAVQTKWRHLAAILPGFALLIGAVYYFVH